jgi:hypothetical protein
MYVFGVDVVFYNHAFWILWQHECHSNVIFILFFPINSFCFINSLFGSGEL